MYFGENNNNMQGLLFLVTGTMLDVVKDVKIILPYKASRCYLYTVHTIYVPVVLYRHVEGRCERREDTVEP